MTERVIINAFSSVFCRSAARGEEMSEHFLICAGLTCSAVVECGAGEGRFRQDKTRFCFVFIHKAKGKQFIGNNQLALGPTNARLSRAAARMAMEIPSSCWMSVQPASSPREMYPLGWRRRHTAHAHAAYNMGSKLCPAFRLTATSRRGHAIQPRLADPAVFLAEAYKASGAIT